MAELHKGDRIRIWTPSADGHMDLKTGNEVQLHKKLGTVVEPVIGGLMIHHDHIHVVQHLSTEYEGSSYKSGSAAARPRHKREVNSDAE